MGALFLKLLIFFLILPTPVCFTVLRFKSVLFLEEVTLSHPRYDAVSQDAFLVSIQ